MSKNKSWDFCCSRVVGWSDDNDAGDDDDDEKCRWVEDDEYGKSKYGNL